MKYQELIKKMTLEEKASLLSGFDFWKSKEVKRLEIPSVFMSDGPHGLRKQAGSGDQLGLNASIPATCFPTAATLANSWDEQLLTHVGELLGEEANALGVNILLGPGLNIKRSPLCGRNFEYYSEDPYLSGKMAAGFIRGFQSKGGATTPKHFAANSQELLRMASDSVLDERTFRELYLTAFEIAVKEGKSKGIMSSYNKINGTYANESEELLQKILRDEWGFEGIVVSDWGGSNDHVKGVAAGAHLEMPTTGGDSDQELVMAVKSGKLSEDLLDKRVDEFLNVVLELAQNQEKNSQKEFDSHTHHHAAQEAAENSAVLLKNEEAILPLLPGTKVALIGDFAKTPRYQGAGSSVVNCTRLDNALGCIGQTSLQLQGFAQGYERMGSRNDSLVQEAVNLAKEADAVLVYVGLTEISESEGLDRNDLVIPENQIALLSAIQKVNPNVVAVISGGSVIEMQWEKYCKGILHGYLAGQAGAMAILKIVTGEVCPSGKLSETYPIAYEDVPNKNYYPGKECTAEYREGIFVGYRYYDTVDAPVRYPFGYGLSYTSFEYSNLQLHHDGVSFQIQNTGQREGAEIAQLYVGLEKSHVFRAKRELKGFCKVFLQPGETKEVKIGFDDKTFRFFDVSAGKFEVEAGEYTICIGASSRDLRLQTKLFVAGIKPAILEAQEHLPAYYSGNITNVSDQEFEKLLGRKLPESKWDQTKVLERNDALSQMFYAKSPIARLAYRIMTGIKDRSIAKGKPNLNILFVYNMPFRGIAKMTGGAMNMEMVDGLLEMINGHFLKGCSHLLKALTRMKKSNKEMAEKLSRAGIESISERKE